MLITATLYPNSSGPDPVILSSEICSTPSQILFLEILMREGNKRWGPQCLKWKDKARWEIQDKDQDLFPVAIHENGEIIVIDEGQNLQFEERKFSRFSALRP
jgi:hypothetical protein